MKLPFNYKVSFNKSPTTWAALLFTSYVAIGICLLILSLEATHLIFNLVVFRGLLISTIWLHVFAYLNYHFPQPEED